MLAARVLRGARMLAVLNQCFSLQPTQHLCPLSSFSFRFRDAVKELEENEADDDEEED